MNLTSPKFWLFSIGGLSGMIAIGTSFSLEFKMTTGEPVRTVPSAEACMDLAAESMNDINDAVVAEDFGGLHSKLSPLWQAEISPGGLGDILSSFVTEEVDLTGVAELPNTFSEDPQLDEQGMLVIAGHYPSVPLRVDYEFTYSKHFDGWKMVGFKVNQVAHEKEMPSEEELRRLCEEALSQFREGVANQDFARLRSASSSLLQKISPEGFIEGFKNFEGMSDDFILSNGAGLTFVEEPHKNKGGLLIANGHYPSPTANVEFSMAFIPENDEWKLSSFNVNVTFR